MNLSLPIAEIIKIYRLKKTIFKGHMTAKTFLYYIYKFVYQITLLLNTHINIKANDSQSNTFFNSLPTTHTAEYATLTSSPVNLLFSLKKWKRKRAKKELNDFQAHLIKTEK